MHASTVSLILRILATVLCAVAIAIALRKAIKSGSRRKIAVTVIASVVLAACAILLILI